MPLLIDSVNGNTNESYMCLEISHEHSQESIDQALSAFAKTQITTLDIHFTRAVKTDPDKIKMILASLNQLNKSSIEYLDLSCNGLPQLGMSGLELVLSSVPSNVKTLVLSDSEWNKLGLDVPEMAQKIRSLTTATVLFEADAFERQLTAQLSSVATPISNEIPSNNRYRLFSTEEQEQLSATSKGSSCVIC